MLNGITDRKIIMDCRETLRHRLSLKTDRTIKIRYSSRAGIGDIQDASYSSEHDLWWFFSGNATQYWNPFGIGEPRANSAVTGRCQINMTRDGYNGRIVGDFATDEDGNLYLLHNGAIGGGQSGIGQEAFKRWFDSGLIDVNFNGKSREYYVIADFNFDDIHSQIAYFVNAVYEFKTLTTTTIVPPPRQERFLDNQESLIRNPYKLPERIVIRGCMHAHITRALSDYLKSLGLSPNRTVKIDTLLTDINREINCIFEVKVRLTSQLLYTAVGQLMVYGLNHPLAQRFLVTEAGFPVKMKDDLAALGITCVPYTIQGSQIMFDFGESLRRLVNN